MRNSIHFRGSALVAALLCAGAMGIAPASAAPTVLVPATSVAASTVDQQGTITVRAMENVVSSSSPVAGVEFNLYPVTGVDLSTDEGWEKARGYIKDPKLVEGHLGDPIALPVTDADGMTMIDGVDRGLYTLRQSNVTEDVEYYDMVFAVPSEDTSDDQTVLAYDLTIFPKPVCDCGETETETRTETVTETRTAPVTPPGTTPATPVTPPRSTSTATEASAQQTPPPRVNTGDGAAFSGMSAWLTILAGLGVLGTAAAATRRKSADKS